MGIFYRRTGSLAALFVLALAAPGFSQTFRGPSYQVFDLSFRKGFRVHGETQLQFQADLFNAFNTTSFNDLQVTWRARTSAGSPPRDRRDTCSSRSG
jgi:hypothetical protein